MNCMSFKLYGQGSHYCGEDHLKWYKGMIAGSRVNMAPVYVSFLEKQEEIRANREATRQRHLRMAGRLRIAILMNQQTQK